MPFRLTASFALALVLILNVCSNDTSPESECLAAVGLLHDSFDSYEELLERGVSQMRDEDAVEKLDAVAAEYSNLLDALETRRIDLPTDMQNAQDLLASGVGLQVSAWASISDGLRFNNTDLIEDAAEMIALSREVVAESRSAIPECSID